MTSASLCGRHAIMSSRRTPCCEAAGSTYASVAGHVTPYLLRVLVELAGLARRCCLRWRTSSRVALCIVRSCDSTAACSTLARSSWVCTACIAWRIAVPAIDESLPQLPEQYGFSGLTAQQLKGVSMLTHLHTSRVEPLPYFHQTPDYGTCTLSWRFGLTVSRHNPF